jgi:hypothetical protein
MSKRTRFEAVTEKREAVKQAEESGQVSDSMDVRKALMAKVHMGEITLQDAQAELKRIQRGSRNAGRITRSQAFRQG